MKCLQCRQITHGFRDSAHELVAGEHEDAEHRGRHGRRQRAAEVIVVQLKHGDVVEVEKLRGNGSVQVIVVHSDILERGACGEAWRHGADQVIVHDDHVGELASEA
ncbi:hypothetical protein Mapa_011506 [Marchantia paleacea]|nr:hypothetical protein Mapa_011506 [Marchantia paleacea]